MAGRKSYSLAYRREAAQLVINTGRPIPVVAREIGVGEALLGRWVGIERARSDHPPRAFGGPRRTTASDCTSSLSVSARWGEP